MASNTPAKTGISQFSEISDPTIFDSAMQRTDVVKDKETQLSTYRVETKTKLPQNLYDEDNTYVDSKNK